MSSDQIAQQDRPLPPVELLNRPERESGRERRERLAALERWLAEHSGASADHADNGS